MLSNKLLVQKSTNFFKQRYMLLFTILFFLYCALFADNFFTLQNMRNFIVALAPVLVAACGVTFPVLNGGTDFSAAGLISLGSVISAYLMILSPLAGKPYATGATIFLVLLMGAFVGAVNGFAVSVLKMPSFIATMAMQMVTRGLALIIANDVFGNTSLAGFPDSFLQLGGGAGYSIITPLLICLLVVAGTAAVLKYTYFGRKVYAVGTNPQAAKVSGINIRKTIFTMMVISGVLTALASILYTAKNQAGVSSMGDKLFINFMTAIILGGTATTGGSGSTINTLYGAAFVTMLDNVMSLYGIGWYYIMLVKGMLLLLLALFNIAINSPGLLLSSKKKGEAL